MLKKDIGKAKACCEVCFKSFCIGNYRKTALDPHVFAEKYKTNMPHPSSLKQSGLSGQFHGTTQCIP